LRHKKRSLTALDEPIVTLPSRRVSDTTEFFFEKAGKLLDSWEIAPIIRGNLDVRKRAGLLQKEVIMTSFGNCRSTVDVVAFLIPET
jgi:hypothetical protein